MDYSERRCRFLGAADAGYDGRCKLQQTSAFCSLLGRPCHLFPLLMASLVGTHYSIWLFEMEYSRWPRRTASRWGHFYFEPGRVARCRLNKSLISDCYPWPNRGNPPKPPRECETRRSQPGGFLHDAQFWNQTQLELTIPREIRGLESRRMSSGNVARRAAVSPSSNGPFVYSNQMWSPHFLHSNMRKAVPVSESMINLRRTSLAPQRRQVSSDWSLTVANLSA
jgi:hypothetical protein